MSALPESQGCLMQQDLLLMLLLLRCDAAAVEPVPNSC